MMLFLQFTFITIKAFKCPLFRGKHYICNSFNNNYFVETLDSLKNGDICKLFKIWFSIAMNKYRIPDLKIN